RRVILRCKNITKIVFIVKTSPFIVNTSQNTQEFLKKNINVIYLRKYV
ncbi:MAG: hypothetical protein RBG13Loki_0757, partial [Promethearchaeota archaeon CR_4]